MSFYKVSLICMMLSICFASNLQYQWNHFSSQSTFTIENVITKQYVSLNLNQHSVVLNDGHNIQIKFLSGDKQIIAEIRTLREHIDVKLMEEGKINIQTNLKQVDIKCQKNTQFVSVQGQRSIQQGYICTAPFHISNLNNANDTFKNWKDIEQSFRVKVEAYMKVHKISQQFYNVIAHNIVLSINSIRWDKYWCLGVQKCDWKLSGIVIDLLGDFDWELGKWLSDNFIDYLEDTLLYSNSQFVQLPQHIELILKYYRQKSPQAIRVGKILNSFINSILLYPVDHIQHQINYRQKEKLHPTLVKMLTIPFHTDSISFAASSIYTQSFMQDLFYNSPSSNLQMAMNKYMYLIKLIVISKVYNGQQYNKQINSLQNIIKTLITDTEMSKEGIYLSVINNREGRFYVREISYETLIPYTYAFTNMFTKQAFKNLSSPLGLLSLKNTSAQYNIDSYRYRGRIHAYFNFKILRDGKHQEEKQQWAHIRTFLIQFLKNNQQLPTSWDNNGKVWESFPWMRILTANFLSDTIQEKQKQNKQQ